jgi:hypothetical protein
VALKRRDVFSQPCTVSFVLSGVDRLSLQLFVFGLEFSGPGLEPLVFSVEVNGHQTVSIDAGKRSSSTGW